MERYIDAEKELKRLYGLHIDAEKVVEAFLLSAPTADVVEVVRCKECKYWDRDDEYCVDFLTQDKNGFCSWWERREDEN